MKKFLFITSLLLAFVAVSSSAQTYSYRSTSFAIKYVDDNGRWTDWSDWQNSDLLITINFDNDIVKIYSQTRQVYKITEFVGSYTDTSGGKQVEFRFIDQDGDRGTMRLRVETNGNSQLYVQFNNCIWVYNVRKI